MFYLKIKKKKHILIYVIFKNKNINLDPEYIMCDFEKGPINAFSQAFPNADIKGCLFHLGQNIIRKVDENGLRIKFRNDSCLEFLFDL